MRRATYLALTIPLLLLQAALVNGCLLLLARYYGAIPYTALSGLLFLFALPIAGGIAAMLIGVWLIRQVVPSVGEPDHFLFLAPGIAGATLWLACGAGTALGLHQYGMLRVHGERHELPPAELELHREAGFATLSGARVDWDWARVGQHHSSSRNKDSTVTSHHYDLVYSIRDTRRPQGPTRAWLCMSISNPKAPGGLRGAHEGYRREVEDAGVGGLIIHNPGDVRDCRKAVRDAAARGVVALDDPVFLSFRPSADEARATLERRAVILFSITNGLLVLLPLLLDIRRSLTDRSLR